MQSFSIAQREAQLTSLSVPITLSKNQHTAATGPLLRGDRAKRILRAYKL